MNFQMRCLCGSPHRFNVVDASRARAAASDPTGTLPIQRTFARELDRRWAQLSKVVPAGVARYTGASQSLAHAAMTGEDPVKGFQAWIDEALRTVVFGINGSWTLNFVRQASDKGVLHARREAAGGRPLVDSPADRTPTLQAFAITELQGIMEAVSQQVVRQFAQGRLNRQPNSVTVNNIRTIIGKVGKERGHALVSFIAVRAFNAAVLDGFRVAGITQVGIDPEKRPKGALVTDAKRQARKIKKAPISEYVEVLTADDNEVCPTCQDISAFGPYHVDEAEDLIPAHPNAVLEGNTIASYGPMHEVVRARFSGRAINLRTDTKEITIGPNHPMLTRSGWKRAHELLEGDELVYDSRLDFTVFDQSRVGEP